MTETNNLNEPELAPYEDIKESVELTRNSKGYGWKFKLKEELITEKTLKRLQDLNQSMEDAYGN